MTTNTVPLLTEAEPVLWMVVGKDGAREAECTYEESADFVRCWDHNHPNNAPHRAVPLYTHAQPIKLTEAQAREAFAKRYRVHAGHPTWDANGRISFPQGTQHAEQIGIAEWYGYLAALRHVGAIRPDEKEGI